jgi:hypothetical protein
MRKSSLWVLNFSTDATSQQMKEQLTGYEVVINTTSGGDIAKAYHSNGDQIIVLDHQQKLDQSKMSYRLFFSHIQQQTEPYRLSIALAIPLFLPLYLQYLS